MESAITVKMPAKEKEIQMVVEWVISIVTDKGTAIVVAMVMAISTGMAANRKYKREFNQSEDPEQIADA